MTAEKTTARDDWKDTKALFTPIPGHVYVVRGGEGARGVPCRRFATWSDAKKYAGDDAIRKYFSYGGTVRISYYVNGKKQGGAITCTLFGGGMA